MMKKWFRSKANLEARPPDPVSGDAGRLAQKAKNELETRFAALEVHNATLKARCATLEARCQSLEARCQSLEAENSRLVTRLRAEELGAGNKKPRNRFEDRHAASLPGEIMDDDGDFAPKCRRVVPPFNLRDIPDCYVLRAGPDPAATFVGEKTLCPSPDPAPTPPDQAPHPTSHPVDTSRSVLGPAPSVPDKAQRPVERLRPSLCPAASYSPDDEDAGSDQDPRRSVTNELLDKVDTDDTADATGATANPTDAPQGHGSTPDPVLGAAALTIVVPSRSPLTVDDNNPREPPGQDGVCRPRVVVPGSSGSTAEPDQPPHDPCCTLYCVTKDALANMGTTRGFAIGLGLYQVVPLREGACESEAYKPGPLVYFNNKLLRMHDWDNELGHTKLMRFVDRNVAFRRGLKGLLKNVLRGDMEPVAVRCLHVHHKRPSVMSLIWLYPCSYHDGQQLHRYAFLMVPEPFASDGALKVSLMQDHIELKLAPIMITTVDYAGHVVAQNSASFGALGFHGRNHRRMGPVQKQVHYLRELFHNDTASYEAMLAATAQGCTYSIVIQITSPILLVWLARTGDEVWHEIQVSTMAHPLYLEPLFIISEADVTHTILTQRHVEDLDTLQQLQRDLLSDILPPQVVDKLLIAHHGKLLLGDRRTPSPDTPSTTFGIPMLQYLEADMAHRLTAHDVMSLATYHKQVTILFTDIVGFTALSQQLHPSDVMLLLNNLFSVYDGLCEMYGVYKVETIGDCFMAAGGLFAPEADESGCRILGGYDPNHAHKVMAFARALLAETASICTPLGFPINVRVGIHSGPCMSGVVGRKMPRFCLFGDTINTASRMETTGLPGKIHVSQETYDLLPDEPWQATAGVVAKGKGAMKTFLWAGEQDAVPRPASHRLYRRNSVRQSAGDTRTSAPRASPTSVMGVQHVGVAAGRAQAPDGLRWSTSRVSED